MKPLVLGFILASLASLMLWRNRALLRRCSPRSPIGAGMETQMASKICTFSDLDQYIYVYLPDVDLNLHCSGGAQKALSRRHIENEWKVELEETPDQGELNATPVVPVVPELRRSGLQVEK